MLHILRKRGLCLCALLSVTLFIGVYASDLYMLVHHHNGEVHEIVAADGMTVHFDNDTLRIRLHDEPVEYDIHDISKLTYSVVSSVATVEVGPTVKLTPAGISLMLDGAHTLRIYDVEGRMYLCQSFVNEAVITHRCLKRGIAILQVDGCQPIKMLVR